MRTHTSTTQTCTAEKLAELKFNAAGILSECRRAMLDRYPFFGNIAMGLNIVPTRDSRCPTAATDGENLYFDIEFLASLKPEDRIFILCHEVLHNAMCHFLRTETRDRDLFNIATDMEVNSILAADGMTPPADALLPESRGFSRGYSAEEYYEMFLQKEQSQQQSGNQNSQNGSSQQGSSSSSSSQDGSSDDDNEQEGSNKKTSAGNKDGSTAGQFDKHIYKGDMMDDFEDDTTAADRWGKVGHDDDFEPHVAENAEEHMKEMVLASAQQVERQRGELPAFAKSLVKKLLEPKIDWKEKLASFISKTSGDRACWAKPNRRFVGSSVYLPSHEGDRIKLGVILDTSGSTARDMSQFLGETNAIVKSFGNYELTLIQCDAEVKSCETYNEDRPLDLEHVDFEVCGGGGTKMAPAFQKIRDEELDIDAIVLFTDGYTDTIDETYTDLPLLTVLTPGGESAAIKIGEVVPFNVKKA